MNIRSRLWLLRAGVGLVSLCAAQTGAAQFAPGVETNVDAALLGGPMKVFLPVNYSATNRWPVIFFYPGQDQQPGTETIRKFTDDRDYIVVGLPYPDAGPAPSSRDLPPHYTERLNGDFARAKSWIAARASVDSNRFFLGGVSKGGWTADLIGEPQMGQLAGLIILLAGRSYAVNESPGGSGYYGKPVYIGDGENDGNMRPARQAAEFFLRRKAVVTLEEFPALGHAMPADAPWLRAWLQVQGRMAGQTDADVKEVGNWFTNRLAAANATSSQGAKYEVFTGLVRDPRFALCTHGQLTLARDLLTASVNLSPGREEWPAERTYRQLIWMEATVGTLDEMKAVRDGFQKLNAMFPNTRFGKLAVEDFALVDAAYQKSLEATRAANAPLTNSSSRAVPPQFPTQSKSGFPAAPKRVGNKIIFER